MKKEKIIMFLIEEGFNPSLKGFKYLIESLFYRFNKRDINFYITRELYPYLSKIYNESCSKIERSIRYSLSTCRKKTNQVMSNREFINYAVFLLSFNAGSL